MPKIESMSVKDREDILSYHQEGAGHLPKREWFGISKKHQKDIEKIARIQFKKLLHFILLFFREKLELWLPNGMASPKSINISNFGNKNDLKSQGSDIIVMEVEGESYEEVEAEAPSALLV